MRIVLLGAPGVGKGTQAQLIINKYNIPLISTGNMLRIAVEINDDLGKKIKSIMDTGHLVKDEIIIELVTKCIKQEKYKKGFVLDGFPRTLNQANAMKNAGISIELVLEFVVPDEIILKRLGGRYVHLPSGRVYHTQYNPPKSEGVDDITGERLTIRQDDQPEIIKKRLTEYHELTIPLIIYYKQQSKSGALKYFKIDGTQSIFQINKQLSYILDSYI